MSEKRRVGGWIGGKEGGIPQQEGKIEDFAHFLCALMGPTKTHFEPSHYTTVLHYRYTRYLHALVPKISKLSTIRYGTLSRSISHLIQSSTLVLLRTTVLHPKYYQTCSQMKASSGDPSHIARQRAKSKAPIRRPWPSLYCTFVLLVTASLTNQPTNPSLVSLFSLLLIQPSMQSMSVWLD